MSAPDTKALPPAPVSTTTRISLSAAKLSRMRLVASHIGSDTALSRSGLLKVTKPTPPSLRESILSVWVMIFPFAGRGSHRFRLVQRGNVAHAEPEFFKYRVGVLAQLRRPRHQPRRRARQRNALADQPHLALVLLGHALGDAEMLDLRVVEHLVDGVDRAARHAGLVQPLDPIGAGAAGEIADDLGVEGIAVLRA